MKAEITTRETAVLDSLAIAADGLADAQESLAMAFERELGIESTDEQESRLIHEYIRTGGRQAIETLLARLGVVVVES